MIRAEYAAPRMPPERPIPRYVAEPPQEPEPSGVFAERLRAEFMLAAADLEEAGEPGELRFYPDRTWHGYTYIPVSAASTNGMEIYGYARFIAGEETTSASIEAYADFTEETAERNPDWKLDLCDEVVGSWRGRDGAVASMTLVWGRALIGGAAIATAELGELTVDECDVVADRFTLLAPDDMDGELLEVRVYSAAGRELARESLYTEED